MDIGNQITNIRKEHKLTQEEFSQLFHISRQTVSNWELGKNYPDLHTLIAISNRYNVSLDTLLKGDEQMVQQIERERLLGKIKHEKSIIDFFTGSGTGIVAGCLFSPDSTIRTITILVGFVMIGIGWYKKARHDKRILYCLEKEQ